MTASMQDLPGSAWLVRAIETTNDQVVFTMSADGIIRDWLGASAAVFGYAADEIIGQPFAILFTERDLEAGMDKLELAVAASIGRSEDDRWHRRKSGGLFWGSGVVEAVTAADGELIGFCKMLRDRTDIRSQMERLKRQLDSERTATDARKESLATVVHELRNPLAPIAASAYVLAKSDDDTIRHAASERLNRQIEVMKRLLDDYAEIAKQARRRFFPRDIELQAELTSAVERLRPLAQGRQQHLSLVLPTVPVVLKADPVLFQQILLNLLSNAMKYTPPGGRIVVHASVEADSVAIRVEDDGVGIAPEILPRIFELFTREVDTDAAPDGQGVGLAVVSRLTAMHGGNVEARSNGKDRGSVFTLRLPLNVPQEFNEP